MELPSVVIVNGELPRLVLSVVTVPGAALGLIT
jgi:hypothetical protein